MSISELEKMVKDMKLKEKNNNTNEIINNICGKTTLTEKCIYIRKYLPPQSVDIETIIKNDLGINKAKDNQSGDGCKNDINYEIKYSGHSKECKLNFVQIRPDHKIDYYIFIGYNMFENNIGKGYIFKIPSENVYELIIKYGGYAHGTTKKLGKITKENIKGRSVEYALRCNPNKKGKNLELWNELLKYEVEYKADNF